MLNLTAYYLIIQEPATAKQTFSSSSEPTVWRTIPVLEFLLQSWENMAELPKISELKPALHKGLANINKWYRKVNDTDAYFICLGTVALHLSLLVLFILINVVTSLRPIY
jgi:hypothetical protein